MPGFDDFNASLQDIADCADKVELTPIANRALGLFTRRAFDEGKNVDGEIRSNYKLDPGEIDSDYTRKKSREKNWTNLGYVDLMYEGLTSGAGMRGNIAVRESQENYIDVGFSNQKQADKLTWNEERYGQVRGLTEENNETVVELYNEALIECLENEGFERTG